jgi:alpha,alpha-trehalase
MIEQNRLCKTVGCFFILVLLISEAGKAQPFEREITVHASSVLEALIDEEDTDGDKNITIDDPHVPGTERGNKRFWIPTIDGRRFEVAGTYFLSNLLQELKLAELAGLDTARLNAVRIFEPPADRISRHIKEYYWDGLTRRVDEQSLATILADEKTTTLDGHNYLYVSPSDRTAYDYFRSIAQRQPELKLKVVRLARRITPQYIHSLDGYHGLLSLALQKKPDGRLEGVPFVVPGGRFNEMYGWDSYFITLGLLHDGRIELAKAMVENFLYQISYYGKILNANRTYYLTRSQPPFLTSMIRAVYQHLPRNDADRSWLKISLWAAIKEYEEVWMNPQRLTATGLSRYFDSGSGPSPEVEPGHFDAVFRMYARKHTMDVRTFEQAYRTGQIKVPELDEYFVHDRCMRESGHDTSYRLENLCANLVTVDLNSLLYKIEMDIASIIQEEFGGQVVVEGKRNEPAEKWRARAEHRRELVNRYLWNEAEGMYFDYDIRERRQRRYVSATALYPLWAGLASNEQARALVEKALPMLELPGGIISSTEESRGPISDDRPPRQWDYPNGWAPHQMMAWQGLLNYGYDEIAQRLIYRWLFTITLNAAHYNGTIPEKFDLVKRSHQVFAEYGNVGTDFAYITREGFGWTNASFQIGLSLLSPHHRSSLNQLLPPEWVF